jgi:hypothetical protein
MWTTGRVNHRGRSLILYEGKREGRVKGRVEGGRRREEREGGAKGERGEVRVEGEEWRERSGVEWRKNG